MSDQGLCLLLPILRDRYKPYLDLASSSIQYHYFLVQQLRPPSARREPAKCVLCLDAPPRKGALDIHGQQELGIYLGEAVQSLGSGSRVAVGHMESLHLIRGSRMSSFSVHSSSVRIIA